jgi:hypothetical protein
MMDTPLPDHDRNTVVATVVQHISEMYVFPDHAETIASTLRDHLRMGVYAAIATEQALCERLTSDIQAVHADPHLAVLYSPTPLPATQAQPSATDQ